MGHHLTHTHTQTQIYTHTHRQSCFVLNLKHNETFYVDLNEFVISYNWHIENV
jgi:hypothetical protein